METTGLHEAAIALGLLQEPARKAASVFRALEAKMRQEEAAIAALSDTVTIPRIVYDILVDQTGKNARALKGLLALVKASGVGVSVQHVSLYMALTGVDELRAKKELTEWAGDVKPKPKPPPGRKPAITSSRGVKWDLYQGEVPVVEDRQLPPGWDWSDPPTWSVDDA